MSPCVAQQQPASLASVLPSGTSGLLLFVCLNPSVEKTLVCRFWVPTPVLHRQLCLCGRVQTLYTQNRVVNQEREFVFERGKGGEKRKRSLKEKEKERCEEGKKDLKRNKTLSCVCVLVSHVHKLFVRMM